MNIKFSMYGNNCVNLREYRCIPISQCSNIFISYLKAQIDDNHRTYNTDGYMFLSFSGIGNQSEKEKKANPLGLKLPVHPGLLITSQFGEVGIVIKGPELSIVSYETQINPSTSKIVTEYEVMISTCILTNKKEMKSILLEDFVNYKVAAPL